MEGSTLDEVKRQRLPTNLYMAEGSTLDEEKRQRLPTNLDLAVGSIHSGGFLAEA